MSISAKKASSTRFGKLSGKLPAVMSQPEIAALWIAEGGNPAVADLWSAIVMAESSGDTQSNTNPCCKGLAQINLYAHTEVSLAQALEPRFATRYSIKLSSNGSNFEPWESYTNGSYRQYLGGSGGNAKGHGIAPAHHGGNFLKESGIPGVEQVGEAFEGAESAAEFLTELAGTLLDFRKLGQLAAEAFAWFLKLILKALWDYVIAPLVHWGERGTSWYWVNFFGTGTEAGSGFGAWLRNNGGIITIGFWSLGYALLWSDGRSAAIVPANESMLGQTVKGVSGLIARRSLVKPREVEEKTPSKPKPITSTIQITRVKEYAVTRNRPVKVAGGGNGNFKMTRRSKANDSSSGPGGARVPRPSEATQKIHLPPGVQRPPDNVQASSQSAAKQGRSGMDSQTSSGSGAKRVASASGAK